VLTIRLPADLAPERTHAARLVFGTLLQVEYRIVLESRADVAVTLDGTSRGVLRMPDVLFSRGESGWPQSAPRPADVPLLACVRGLTGSPDALPILFGARTESGEWWTQTPEASYLGVDVLGTAFWMMTRVEELLEPARDRHERFAGTLAHAIRAGYIHRPVVDETADLLAAALRNLWPRVLLPRRRAAVVPTHDVDRPFKHLFQTPARLLRTMIGDIVRRRGVYQVMASPNRWLRVRRGFEDADPFFTFNWLMEASEAAGLKSAFYFICGHSAGALDGDYDIRHPRVRTLLRRIHARGHEIGVHGSYNSFRCAETLRREVQELQMVCDQEQISIDSIGGRQHVLRFDALSTPAVWQQAGLTYDSTLGYADASGFRCGTCRPFPLYDHAARRTLSVIERPLVCMDVTLTGPQYEDRTLASAQQRIASLRTACQAVGGEFVVLWHNCHLVSRALRSTYQSALA
jgi:hypothetical protein